MKIRSTFVSNSSSSSFILRTTGPSELIDLLQGYSKTSYRGDDCEIRSTFQDEVLLEDVEELEEHIKDLAEKIAEAPVPEGKARYYDSKIYDLQQRKESAECKLKTLQELVENRNAWILRISDHGTFVQALLELAIDSDPNVTMEEW